MGGRQNEVRSAIIDDIRKTVVGPRGGAEEALPKREDPTKGYLSGILFPRQTPIDPEDDEQGDAEMSGDDGEQVARFNPNAGLKPSSFGLTCTVSGEAEKVAVRVEYGKYTLSGGKDQEEFRRTPFSESFEIRMDGGGATEKLRADPRFLLKHTVREGRVLSVFVVNDIAGGSQFGARAENCIFQPSISLSAPDGASKIFVDGGGGGGAEDRDSALFDLLFRGKRNFASGHGCAVAWDESEAAGGAVSRLETTFVPEYTVPTIRPREMGLEGLDMARLDKAGVHEYAELLSPIADAYEGWIEAELESRLPEVPARLRETAEAQIGECRRALGRVRRGIELVSAGGADGEAFRFANRVMLWQRSHGEWAKKNREAGRVEGYGPPAIAGRWRLFQLAFLLLSVESVSNPRSEDRRAADVLWFATGGGKTEAYMGVIAFAMAHRRLRKSEPDHVRYGTVAIMRYTLRLLTLQQFQRAAAMMCACEHVRRADERWGGEPFYVGLWVGSKTAPNRRDEAREAIDEARRGGSPVEHNPMQIISCPWCGADIGPREYEVSGRPEQCRAYCSRSQCEFSRRRGGSDGGLPVLVVDEDIYCRCPPLLIGTVDKFAQITWNEKTRAIFGRVDKYCTKHGFTADGLSRDCRGEHRDGSEQFPLGGSLEPPELIVQDELHLISGPLGTLTGLYEAAIDILCTGEDGVRPKIVASTATTRRAAEQIAGLFDRGESMVFPPQGFEFGESFFAERVPPGEDEGKTYLGVCATARSGLATLGMLSASALRKVRSLREGMGENGLGYGDLDPYYTLVSYFNTIRELGGANRMYADSVPNYIQRIFSNFEGGGEGYRNQQLDRVELTSRVSSGRIPEILRGLEASLGEGGGPTEVLLCTNMLSVGVDIPRLGLMIVNGQPKNHSEYIQATGRIGRASPGLVIANYNYFRPRDLSHYENFAYYHSTFHKNVEPISLTPFAPRARDKALFGVLVALVRHLDKRLAANDGAKRFDPRAGGAARAVGRAVAEIGARVQNIDPAEAAGTRSDLDGMVGRWDGWASDPDLPLVYRKSSHEKARRRDNEYRLLGSIESPDPAALVQVPNSLRDAEQAAGMWYIPDAQPEGGGA